MKRNGQMIYLADIEDLSYKEIAKVLKKTVGQVKINIHRGKQKLKESLKEGGSQNV